MIMSEVHLDAYRQADFKVGAIASRNVEKTQKIAERYGIAKDDAEQQLAEWQKSATDNWFDDKPKI